MRFSQGAIIVRFCTDCSPNFSLTPESHYHVKESQVEPSKFSPQLHNSIYWRYKLKLSSFAHLVLQVLNVLQCFQTNFLLDLYFVKILKKTMLTQASVDIT